MQHFLGLGYLLSQVPARRLLAPGINKEILLLGVRMGHHGRLISSQPLKCKVCGLLDPFTVSRNTHMSTKPRNTTSCRPLSRPPTPQPGNYELPSKLRSPQQEKTTGESSCHLSRQKGVGGAGRTRGRDNKERRWASMSQAF